MAFSSMNYSESKLETAIKQEPMDYVNSMQNSRVLQPVPIKLEDLDGIGKYRCKHILKK